MKNLNIRGFFLVAIVAGLTAGCGGRSDTDGIVYGEAQRLGEGTARTWVQFENKQPVAVGVRLSERSLKGLPAHVSHEESESMLPLPRGVRDVPFTHVGLNWNPAGHEPPGIYDAPHFDFHFYMISTEERDRITEADPHYQMKLDREPSEPFIPAGYMSGKDGIPRMGRHWVDMSAPELNGQPFTRTMIFGSYDGRIIFFEPMITNEFLASKPDDRQAITWPERFEKTGYYPTEYSVRWDGETREYVVGLEKMKMFD